MRETHLSHQLPSVPINPPEHEHPPSPSPVWMWWRLHYSWTKWFETPQTSLCTATAAGNTTQHRFDHMKRLASTKDKCSRRKRRVETDLLLEVNLLLLHQLAHSLWLHSFFEQLVKKSETSEGHIIVTTGLNSAVGGILIILFMCLWRTKSFSLSWRSSDSFSSSWAWFSLASTSCCCRSLCFTTLSMCCNDIVVGYTPPAALKYKNKQVWVQLTNLFS